MSTKSSEIDQKKEALQKELDDLRKELDDSIDKVSEGVSKSLEPIQVIKKHPFKALAISTFAGFLLAYHSKGSRNTIASNSVLNGIKREITSRLMDIALEKLEQTIKKEDQ